MSAYVSLLKMRFISGIQYRAAALAGVFTQFGFGFMFILQYQAFYRSNPDAFPMEMSQIVSYVWIQQAFLALLFFWFFQNSIFADITSGQVACDLSRPMDLYSKWFCQCVAGRLANVVLRCVPILVIAMILPEPYRLTLPRNIAGFGAFLLSALLAMAVVVAFSMFVYISTFYTMSPIGVRTIVAILADFLAGAIVPLPFFPDGIRQFAELLPFAAMQNMPLRIYSGNISGINAVQGLIFQFAWLAVLVFLGKLWMSRALKKVVVQGG